MCANYRRAEIRTRCNRNNLLLQITQTTTAHGNMKIDRTINLIIPIKDEMFHALLAQLFSGLFQQTVKDASVFNVLQTHQITSMNDE